MGNNGSVAGGGFTPIRSVSPCFSSLSDSRLPRLSALSFSTRQVPRHIARERSTERDGWKSVRRRVRQPGLDGGNELDPL